MDTWNRQRKRTRDRLLQYDFSIIPTMPHVAGLKMIYPWDSSFADNFKYLLFNLAKEYGYQGSQQTLFEKFKGGNIYKYNTLNDFPAIGAAENLYLDISTGIIYYYISTSQLVNAEKIAIVGGAIVGYSIIGDTTETRLYLPIRALPLENLIYDCGDATEYID